MKTQQPGNALIYKHLPDDQLAALVQNGNNLAFDVIYLRHRPPVFHYLYNHLYQHRSYAPDLMQDTFLKALIALRDGSYEEQGRLLHWLFRIARYVLGKFLRTIRFMQLVNDELDTLEAVHSYRDRAMALQIGKALRKLSPRIRTMIILHFIRKWTMLQVAQRFGIATGTAKRNCFDGRNRLKQLLREYL